MESRSSTYDVCCDINFLSTRYPLVHIPGVSQPPSNTLTLYNTPIPHCRTRIEVANEEKNTKDVDNAKEVVLRSGVRYKDLRIGGGQNPDKGLLAVINYRGKIVETGDIFEDTFARGKPIVYLFGGRPFQAGMCAGLEEALKTMKAGGRRIVTVPSELGFGAAGGFIQSTRHAGDKAGQIPPNSTLEYEVVLERVSIPPS